MSIADRWLLPDGVEEVLPPKASHLEAVRRRLLDLFEAWGYELVITPMVEYLESLLTGTGKDLDLKTFKVTDRVSGRMMGIRADMTPQVARIDAHSLGRESIVRLCYAGTILHATADNMLASRTPISVGAELFGDRSSRADLEIVSMMIDAVRGEQTAPVHIELGDVGIFRELMLSAGLTGQTEETLFELIQRKDTAELADRTARLELSPALAGKLTRLPGLCGGVDMLEEARALFAGDPAIIARLDNLSGIAEGLAARFPAQSLYFDLSELRGYNYHTGIVFAAYGASGQRLAKGGRYDRVGEVFGRSRAATGFDIDLKVLAAALPMAEKRGKRVHAPAAGEEDEAGRWAFVSRLRGEGYVVVEQVDGGEGFDYQVVNEAGEWTLQPVSQGAGSGDHQG